MKKSPISLKAFTLIEVVIVVIILGVLATIATPRITGMVNKARAKDALNNLSIIYSANLIFKAQNNNANFAGGGVAAINNINGNNSLNIIPNGVNYDCSDGTTCTAVGANFSFTLTLNNQLVTTGGVNPTCAGSDCPP